MKRRELLASMATLSSIGALGLLPGCASQVLRGTGDLGVVIGRANGTLYLVNTSTQSLVGEVPGRVTCVRPVVFGATACSPMYWGATVASPRSTAGAPHRAPRDAGGQFHRRRDQRRRHAGGLAELHARRCEGVRCAHAGAAGRYPR
jgi:hypothetical protein